MTTARNITIYTSLLPRAWKTQRRRRMVYIVMYRPKSLEIPFEYFRCFRHWFWRYHKSDAKDHLKSDPDWDTSVENLNGITINHIQMWSESDSIFFFCYPDFQKPIWICKKTKTIYDTIEMLDLAMSSDHAPNFLSFFPQGVQPCWSRVCDCGSWEGVWNHCSMGEGCKEGAIMSYLMYNLFQHLWTCKIWNKSIYFPQKWTLKRYIPEILICQ